MFKRVLFTNRWLPYLLVGPQLLIIFVFFYWPTAQAMYWSFTLEPPFGGPSQWVGFRNIREIFGDPTYVRTIVNTLVFSSATTIISLGVGLILAIFADRGLRGLIVYKTAIMWPYAVAAPVAAIALQFIFQPNIGFMGALNVYYPGLWNPHLNSVHAMIMVIVASSWISITFNFVFFLAGLQSIPRSMVEAAAMDGAGPVKRFFDIVFPLLTPTFFFLVVLNVTTSFTEGFGIINIMTQGGPGGGTTIMVYKIYQDGFVGLDLSSSSAQSLVLMMFVILLTFAQFRWIERKVHYTG